MSYASDFTLSLASLPSDIIRRIIRIDIAIIESMKLISPRWNTLALGYLTDPNNRKFLPALKYFCWRIDNTGLSTITIHIAAKHRSYVGTESLTRFSATHLAGRTRAVPRYSNPNTLTRIDSGRLFENSALNNRLKFLVSRLFRKCSRIEKVELKMCMTQRQNELDFVITELNGLGLNALAFSGLQGFDHLNEFHAGDGATILSFIRAHELQRIILSTDTYSPTNIDIFLQQVLLFVPCVVFDTRYRHRSLIGVGQDDEFIHWAMASIRLNQAYGPTSAEFAYWEFDEGKQLLLRITVKRRGVDNLS